LVAKNEHKDAQQGFPDPKSSVIETHPTGNVSRNYCSGGSCNGKRAEYE
jgi:hypothetical protein